VKADDVDGKFYMCERGGVDVVRANHGYTRQFFTLASPTSSCLSYQYVTPRAPPPNLPPHFQLDSFHLLIPRFFKTKIYIFSLFNVTDFSGYLKWNTMSSTVLFSPVIVTKWWPSPRPRPRPVGLGRYHALLNPFHSTVNSFSTCSSCGFLVQTQMHHEVSHHRRMSGVLRRNPHESRRRQRSEVKVINITLPIMVI
jgi:hypothetical protein